MRRLWSATVTRKADRIMATGLMNPRKPAFEIYRPEKKITYLKIGLYGDPGVGKTTLAATAPKPLFLNAEAGDVALRNKGIDVIKIDHFAMMNDVYDFIEEGVRTSRGTFYETIVIDSLSELSKRAMDMVLKSEGREHPHQGDWGRSMEYVRRVVRKFRDLDIHTVFVMGSVFKEDPDTGIAQQMPNLPGKLGPEIAGYFDILGYMNVARNPKNVKEYVRMLHVQPTPKWRAKDRTNTLGASLHQDQLDLTKVLQFVNGKEKHVTLTVEENEQPASSV